MHKLAKWNQQNPCLDIWTIHCMGDYVHVVISSNINKLDQVSVGQLLSSTKLNAWASCLNSDLGHFIQIKGQGLIFEPK